MDKTDINKGGLSFFPVNLVAFSAVREGGIKKRVGTVRIADSPVLKHNHLHGVSKERASMLQNWLVQMSLNRVLEPLKGFSYL